MANIFSLDAAVKQVIQDALDDMLADGADGGLAKRCLLVYPARRTACVNCVIDPRTGRSTGRYRQGGPSPFEGRCPVCGGEGGLSEQASEELVLGCSWDSRRFATPCPPGVRAPCSLVETKGYLRDAPKVLKAEHLVLQLPASVIRKRFKLLVEPGDRSNIIQGRYFHAVWEQADG